MGKIDYFQDENGNRVLIGPGYRFVIYKDRAHLAFFDPSGRIIRLAGDDKIALSEEYALQPAERMVLANLIGALTGCTVSDPEERDRGEYYNLIAAGDADNTN